MKVWRILILVGLISNEGINGHFEFNNVKCLSRDPAYMTFEHCYLRSVNRTYKYFSMKSRFSQFPINNCFVTVKLLKRENKHIFDRYNITIDVCRFLKYRSNPIANVLFGIFESYSNMNHTCPFVDDVMIEKLPIAHVNSVVKSIIPDGQYVLNTTWTIRKIKRADVTVYFTKY